MKIRFTATAFATVLLTMVAATAQAQVDARMFRQPTVSQTQIAFVYAGDIWIVSKKGGTATRLSSPQGEESFPRFSPDGSKIAYSAAYDGNTDVYVVSATGGEPMRLTHHPMADRVIGWHPDGKRVLFASSRESGRQRFSQFFLVGLDGGLARKAAGAVWGIRRHRRQRHRLRLHADVAGLPHLEALSRRLGAGSVALQPEDVRLAQPDERSGERRAADVARQQRLLRLGSWRRRSGTTSGSLDVASAKVAAGHAVHGLRHHVSLGRRRLDRVPGRRPAVSARLFFGEGRSRFRSAS